MRNRHIPTFIILSVIAVLIWSGNSTDVFSAESTSARPTLEDVQKDRFAFLQNKWKAYFRSLDQFKASTTYRQFSCGKIVEEHNTEFEAYCPYSSDVRKNTRTARETASVIGPRYSFELNRDNDSAQWVVETLGQNALPQKSAKDWDFPSPYERPPTTESLDTISTTRCAWVCRRDVSFLSRRSFPWPGFT